MRWTKVPEWLVTDLLAAPRDRGVATPGSALLTYTVLAARFADWQSRIAETSQRDLAAATDLSRSSVGRCVELLERVRALDVLPSRAGWRGRSRYLLAADSPLPTGGHLAVGWSTGGPDCPTGGHLRAIETAGQDRSRGPLVGRTTQNQESSPDENDAEDLWGLIESPGLFTERAPDVVSWLRDPDRLSRPIESLPALRAAARLPRPGTRLSDARGTDRGDSGENTLGAGSTSGGEGGSR